MAGPNWANQTIWTGDNLAIMRGMNSESVDLIYLDPPFNSKANYAAPIGSRAAGAEFKDTWSLSEIDVEWINLIEAKHPRLYRVLLAAMTKSDQSYLVYMAARLLEMQRLLKPTGSIYLHCDPTMSHYLKLLMDSLFGRLSHRNEVVWCYTGPGSPKMRQFNRKHDIIHWYSVGATWTFNRDAVRIPHKKLNTNRQGAAIADPLTPEMRDAYLRKGKIPETWWPDFSPVGRIKRERTNYPTQKPVKLVERIVLASSNRGDVVLDPFCGCATACIAAELHGRHWVGVDISPKAAELVVERMREEVGAIYRGAHRTDVPLRTDHGPLPRYNSRENRSWLYGHQEGHCQGCGVHFESRHLEVDHIIAKAKGGTDHRDNLQLLCGSCNRVKGDRGMDYLMSKLNMTTRQLSGNGHYVNPSL